jgi:hypothetical protein
LQLAASPDPAGTGRWVLQAAQHHPRDRYVAPFATLENVRLTDGQIVWRINSPAETQLSSFLKERRAMSQPKFNVNDWGIVSKSAHREHSGSPQRSRQEAIGNDEQQTHERVKSITTS